MNLPPGEHTVRIEYLSAGGGVLYSSPPRTVRAGGGREGVGAGTSELNTIVEHFGDDTRSWVPSNPYIPYDQTRYPHLRSTP